MTTSLIPALGYIRVSTAKQANDNKDGPTRQRNAIEAWARANGYEVVRWFIDIEKGKNRDRAEWAAMLDDIAHGSKCRVVIVERADRLARRLLTSELLIDDLRKEGCVMYDCAGNNLTAEDSDDSDPDQVMIRQILSVIAAHEKNKGVWRMRAARRRIRMGDPSKGVAPRRCEGAKPYGAGPGEIEALDRLCVLYAQGRDVKDIVQIMNAEGHKPRHAPEWNFWSISRAITRRLASNPAIRRARRVARKGVKAGPEPARVAVD